MNFMTINSTCAEALKEEWLNGDALHRSQYLLTQEHTLRGEARLRATRWATDRGLDPIISDAYIKESKEGGGTSIIAQGQLGIRPMVEDNVEFEGRLTMGTIDIDGEATAASIYGISGAGVAGQRRLWCHLAQRIRAAGRPFVIGGDWQVIHEEMRASGFAELLVGEHLCHSGGDEPHLEALH